MQLNSNISMAYKNVGSEKNPEWTIDPDGICSEEDLDILALRKALLVGTPLDGTPVEFYIDGEFAGAYRRVQ